MKRPINLRDLGGIKTKDGRTIKSKRLLRSARLTNVTDEEAQSLVDNYDLSYIVDFRSDAEIKRGPGNIPSGVEYTQIDLLKKHMQDIPSNEHFDSMEDPNTVHDMMKNVYSILLKGEDSIEGYTQFLNILLNQSEGAVLFHCSAGKDRTGVAAAMILTLLGVDRKAIMQDYLLTNVLRKEVGDRHIDEERKKGKTEIQLAAIKLAIAVDESYLTHIFDLADEQSGSFYDYILETYNLSQDDVDRLKNLYLI